MLLVQEWVRGNYGAAHMKKDAFMFTFKNIPEGNVYHLDNLLLKGLK